MQISLPIDGITKERERKRERGRELRERKIDLRERKREIRERESSEGESS